MCRLVVTYFSELQDEVSVRVCGEAHRQGVCQTHNRFYFQRNARVWNAHRSASSTSCKHTSTSDQKGRPAATSTTFVVASTTRPTTCYQRGRPANNKTKSSFVIVHTFVDRGAHDVDACKSSSTRTSRFYLDSKDA